jgi:hypothetical protein
MDLAKIIGKSYVRPSICPQKAAASEQIRSAFEEIIFEKRKMQ